MKIIFFGSPEFAVPVLEALTAREDVLLVVTRPDRKKGRSLKIGPTAVKRAADKLKSKTFQPDNVNSKDSIGYLKTLGAELFIVVSFGQILCAELLDIPKLYSINLHASLLPEYRGAAPVNWAIANGEKETGVTVIRMREKMDEGDIILKQAVPIDSDADAIVLSKKLSRKGISVLLDSIDLIKKDTVSFTKQISDEATYAPKLKKEDGLVDWRWSADKIYNRIRAFVPWPGCYTYWNKRLLKIWHAKPEASSGSTDVRPGTVLEVRKDNILVNTGGGAIRIEELQLEGKRRMKAEELIAGHKEMASGTVFLLQK